MSGLSNFMTASTWNIVSRSRLVSRWLAESFPAGYAVG
jgi:hypothetical protein